MHQPPLILIVDDAESFREIFSTKLKASGFAVETASNAKDSIDKIRQLQPDLVLMDVEMPGMSGTDALLAIKADPEIKNTRVVFLTQHGRPNKEAQEFNRQMAQQSGAEDYILKSVDIDVIVRRVEEFLK